MLFELEGMALRAIEVAIPLFNYIAQNLHHSLCLCFCESLILHSLDELECVKMMVFPLRCGCTEIATSYERRRVVGRVLGWVPPPLLYRMRIQY